MPANFSVRTRSTLLVTDSDGDNVADAGDVLRTTLTFHNTGTTAFDVTIQDLLNGSTLVPGSVKIGPMAVDDLSTISGNTPKTYTFAELLGNDIDPDGSNATMTITGVSGAVHGTVTIDTVAQTVTFVPETGYQGAAQFNYSVADAQGLTNVAGFAGTVNVTISGQIWYVDANYAGANGAPDGSYLKPFTSLQPLNDDGTAGTGRVGPADGIVGDDDVDGANDTIFIYDRGANAINGGITLESGQKLFGDAHSFVVNGISIGVSTNQSTINSSSATNTNYGVTLSTGNEIQGINLDGDNNGTTNLRDGGGTVGSFTMANSSITGNGQAVDIDQGGNLNVTLTSLSSSGSTAEGVQLAGSGTNPLTGSFTANGGTIDTATAQGFLVGVAGGGTASSGGSIDITYTGALTNNGGSATNAIEIQDRTGGTVTFSGAVNETAGPGIVIDGNAGTITFSSTVSLSTTTSNALTLTNNSGTVNFSGGGNGLDITTTTGVGLTMTNGGTLNVQGSGNTIASTTGQMVNINGGSVGSNGITFGTIAATGSVTGIAAVLINNLDGTGNTFNGGNVTVAGTATGVGLQIGTGSAANFSFGTVTIGTGANTVASDGIFIEGAGNGTVNISSVDIDATAGYGVVISSSNNSVSIGGGTIGATNDAASTSLFIAGGTGNVTIGASISNNTANQNLVDINGHSTGTITLSGNLSSTGGAGGIDITNSGGTINFTGSQITLTTGANTAVNVTNNSAAINFTGGSLDITTTGGAGLSANATGGSVTVTGNSNTVSTGAGTAVNIQGTDIGAAGVTFNTVNTSGAASGIILNGTGTGAFTVVGTAGVNGSGGSIVNSTNDGIQLTNTGPVSLTGVTITGSGGSGIVGTGVTGLSLTNVTSSTNGNAVGEGGVYLTNASGNLVVTNSTFNANADDNFSVLNDTGTLNVTVTGSNFTFGAPTAFSDDNLILQANNTANIIALITSSIFTNADGDHFQFSTNNSASGSSHITFTNNNLSNSQGNLAAGSGVTISPAGSADLRLLISGNTITDTTGGFAINLNAVDVSSASLIEATIQSNNIGTNGVADSGPETSGAIQVRMTGSGTMNALVTGNNIYDFGSGSAIDVSAAAGVVNGSNGTMNITVTNNLVTGADPTNSLRAFTVQAGASSGGPFGNVIRVLVDNNTWDNTYSGGQTTDARYITHNGAQLQSPGYGGASNDAAAFATHMQTQNGPGGNGTASAALGGTPGTFGNTPGGANPTLPQTPTLPPPPMMLAPEPPQAFSPDSNEKGGGHPDQLPPPSDDDTATGGTGGKTDNAGELPGDTVHPIIVDDGVVTQAELDYLVNAAIQRWIDAGATAEQVAAMRAATFSVADMTGVQLGMSDGSTIYIDNDGGRAGWFLDTTPGADEEYSGTGTRLTATGGAAAEGVDLLTVLMHELGHQAGLGDTYNLAARDDLMYGYAYEGERRLPADGQAAGAVPGSIPHPVFQLGPVVVGTVPGDNAFVVQYDSTVDAQGEDRLVQYFNNDADISWRDVPAGAVQSASTNSELLAVDSLTLGDRVFLDANGNGIFDAGESGIANVSLTLFADTNNNGVYDDGVDLYIGYNELGGGAGYQPGVDTPAANGTGTALTVTTDANGFYAFNFLANGDYIVRVNASNFLSGGALEGRVSSSVLVAAADPNTNTDNDNNGQGFTGYAATRAIRLDLGQEPTAGPGNDTNNTLDIGFVDTNSPPVNSVPLATQTFNEDGTLTFSVANGNLISVDDPDVGAGNLTVTLSIQTGILTLGGTAGLVSFTGDGTNNVSLTGSLAAINNALNGLVYNPGADYNGDRTLTITTNDNGNTGIDPGTSGTATSEQDSDTVSIHVTAVNDAPVVIGDGTVDADPIVEDSPTGGQTVSSLFQPQYSDAADAQFSVGNPGGSSPGSFSGVAVVANGSNPAAGQWQYFNSNTSTWVDIGARSTASALLIGAGTFIRFNPALDFTGAAPTLTVNLIDNSLGFGITFGQLVDISGPGATGGSTAYSTGTVVLSEQVTPANIAPVLDLDADDSTSVGTGYSGSFTEGGPAVRIADTDVSITDTDVGDDIVTATITLTNPEPGDVLNVGTLPGTISLDGSSTATTVILTAAPGTSAADFQAAIAAITFSNSGDNPTDGGTNVSRSITVVVNDGDSNSNNATATIAVTDVNDEPSGTSSTITAIEDTFRLIQASDLGFSDVDGTLASVTISSVTGGGIYFDADGTAGAGAPILVSTFPATYTAQDLADGKVSFRAGPNANGSGLGSITFTVTDDDGASDPSPNTLTVDVTAVNDSPVLSTSSPVSATEQTAVAILPAGSVSDADLDARNGGLGDYGGATFSVNRNPAANAQDVFSVVAGPNFVVDGINLKTLGGQIFGYINANANGLISFTFTSLEAPATSSLVDEVIQSVRYTNSSDNPPASVTLAVGFTDGSPGGGQGAGATGLDVDLVTVNIASVNDAPVNSAPATRAGTEDTNLVFSGVNAITVSDVDAATLQVTLSVAHGVLTLSGTTGLSFSVGDGIGDSTMTFSGTTAAINAALDGLIYRGNLNYNGSDTLTITTSDLGATGSPGTLTDVDSVAITLAADGRIDGTSGNDTLDGTPNPDFFWVQQGGDDILRGFGGNDVFLFLGALTGADQVDGGAGTDQIAIQGNYSGLTLGTGVVSIESLAILPGSDTRFGDPGTNFYDYDITTRDVNVAAGVQLVVDANRLRAGEDLTFNGSAETDGSFFIYGGGGADTLTGGNQNDVFLFGAAGQWGSSDVINGGAGIDQLALRGDYTITFGAGQLISIESFGLLSAHDTRFGALGDNYDYNLTMHNGNVAAGVQLTVDGAKLRATETLTFNGSAELDGTFRIFGGAGNDVLTGGAGNDILVGRNGADTLTGGGGADIFRYDNVSESTPAGRDGIQDFTLGDLIDLSRIDANANVVGNQAFSFIGNSAFSNTAGELRAVNTSGPIWTVSGDVNGDGVADFEVVVVVTDAHPLGVSDFSF